TGEQCLPEVQSVQREACSDCIDSARYNRNVYVDDVARIAVDTATVNSTVLAKEADKWDVVGKVDALQTAIDTF
ncbi:unnamed protein product, partial [Onchocerca ochengi]|uniref:Chemotaxis protein n=1 Tax=Onchocerca ochengi TaxID=42157 RepID=A0A182EUD8_ONCOC